MSTHLANSNSTYPAGIPCLGLTGEMIADAGGYRLCQSHRNRIAKLPHGLAPGPVKSETVGERLQARTLPNG
jgi:hypothetical protein